MCFSLLTPVGTCTVGCMGDSFGIRVNADLTLSGLGVEESQPGAGISLVLSITCGVTNN